MAARRRFLPGRSHSAAGAGVGRMRDAGGAAIGMLLAFTAVTVSLLLVCEYYRAFTIRQSVIVELTRAVNTSVDLSMSDLYRQDRISRLDEWLAHDRFYEYLYGDLGLAPCSDGTLEAVTDDGKTRYKLDITHLTITAEPPQISVKGDVIIDSGFFGTAVSAAVRLPVYGSSENRRMIP